MNRSINISSIQVGFDFTQDCDYWPDFWERNDGLGAGKVDPDSDSQMLRAYHKTLWSKELPNGDYFNLEYDGGYLSFRNMRLGSDSITASFRYKRYKEMMDECIRYYGKEAFHNRIEEYLHNTYTIGGAILFPKHQNSINQCRGRNSYICDRWDLTLECIRRFYKGITAPKDNPLGEVLLSDKSFFDLFVDFRGYCEFFFLQDCVSENYEEVKTFIPMEFFPTQSPLPKTLELYNLWLQNNENFVKLRNERIRAYIKETTDYI